MSEALVLLPDMLCDARLFAPQFNALARERPVMVAPVSTGERVEEIASELLSALPVKFALAGQGMGGAVAIEILRRAPDRVSRIALICTSPLADTPQEAVARDTQIVGARAGRLADMVAEVYPPQVMAPGPARMKLSAGLVRMATDLGVEGFVRQARAMQRRRDQQGTLRRCKVPALVMGGAHDGATPVKRAAFLAELIPFAELSVIEEAGHFPTLEAPEATTAALRAWLAQPLVLR